MTQGRVHAQIFGEVADDYDRLRPEYPAEAVLRRRTGVEVVETPFEPS